MRFGGRLKGLRVAALLWTSVPYGFAQPAMPPYVINTAAGTPPALSNKGPATSAFLRYPHFVVADSAGNFYFGEQQGYAIRKVAPDGTITTVAGTGTVGTAQDGQPAASAPVGSVEGVAFDSNGDLYFADGSRIRKIPSSGILTTVAGTSSSGFSGDGGPATQARFGNPIRGINFDRAGSLYIADTTNNRVRKVDTNGVVTTVATNVNAFDVTLDASGNLYVSDRSNHRIQQITPSGTITTYAGTGTGGFSGDGGSAASAQLSSPGGLAFDASGRLYVADGNRVRRITPTSTGTVIATVAGGNAGFSGDGGLASNALLNGAWGLSMDPTGNLYISDSNNHRIRKISPAGIINTVAGSTHFTGDGGPATSATLSFPSSVAVDGPGNVFIADTLNHRVRQLSQDGSIRTIAGTGNPGFSGDGGPARSAALSGPQGVALDSAGNLYVSDTNNNRVRKITPAGIVSAIAGNGTSGSAGDGAAATSAALRTPVGLAMGSNGNLYIADSGNARIRMVNPQGIITTVAGNGTAGFAGDGGAATAASLNTPANVAVDSAGNLYIADRNNFRVRKVDSKGTITTFAGTGVDGTSGDGGPAAAAALGFVSSVAVDSAGNLFIGDPQQGRIRMVSPTGIITTIAGNGVRAYSGDGVLATSASLGVPGGGPSGLAVGPGGVLYLADYNNQLIRKLTPNVPSTLAIVSGNNQAGIVGTSLANALIVSVVGPTGVPVADITVTFAVTAGSATLSTNSTVTASNGQCGIGVTPGATAGPITVTATVSGLPTVTFTLTGLPVPVPAIASGGVVGAGGSVPPVLQISPGALVNLTGNNFLPANATPQDGRANGFPTILAGVCVLVAGQRAPIFLLSQTQITFQVPASLQNGDAPIQVAVNCGDPTEARSDAITVTAQDASPEFVFFKQNPDGVNPIFAMNSSGGNIGAPGLLAPGAFTPAQPGDTITMYLQGMGLTNPPIDAGKAATDQAPVALPVQVTIGDNTLQDSDVLYAGAASQGPGIYQINVHVPDVTADGDQRVQVTVGGFNTPPGGYITVLNQKASSSAARARR